MQFPPVRGVRIGPGMPRSLFVKDAAALLGVSRRTVYYRIRDGRLRTIRTIGGSQRVLLESIEALLREERELEVRGRGAGASDTGPCAKSQALSRRARAGRDCRGAPL
jgi:excisionase family DNA binding protein